MVRLDQHPTKVDLLIAANSWSTSLMSSGPSSVTALIDLSVRRRGVLTRETWIERALRWAGRDLTINIEGWKPKPHVDGPWLQEQIECLPTIARLATQGSILLYTYSELEFEEWSGRPEMMGTLGDLFSREGIKKCPAAVNRPRFRRNAEFQYYLKRDELIGFCSFFLRSNLRFSKERQHSGIRCHLLSRKTYSSWGSSSHCVAVYLKSIIRMPSTSGRQKQIISTTFSRWTGNSQERYLLTATLTFDAELSHPTSF